MEITQLDEFFDVTQYQLWLQSATLELVDGDIEVFAQYAFRNVAGMRKGPTVSLKMVVTPQQSSDLRTILVAVLQVTNAEIEAVTGWTKWTEEE